MLGVTHILNLSDASDSDPPSLATLSYVQMPIKDEDSADISSLFSAIFNFINDALEPRLMSYSTSSEDIST